MFLDIWMVYEMPISLNAKTFRSALLRVYTEDFKFFYKINIFGLQQIYHVFGIMAWGKIGPKYKFVNPTIIVNIWDYYVVNQFKIIFSIHRFVCASTKLQARYIAHSWKSLKHSLFGKNFSHWKYRPGTGRKKLRYPKIFIVLNTSHVHG